MNVRLGYASVEPVMPPPPPPENFVLSSSGAYRSRRQPSSLSAADRTAFVRTYRKAMALFDRGDWEGAEGAFKNLIRIQPVSEVYLLLGYTFFFRVDFLKAGHYFGKAAKQDPGNLAAQLSLALAYNRQGKPEKAVGAVLKVTRLNRENADAHFLLGYVRHQLGQWDEAEDSYRTAIRLKRNFAEAYQYLALLYFEMGNLDEDGRERRFRGAIETYRELISACPEEAATYVNIGYIYDRLRESEEAREAYRKAVENAPKDLMGLAALGTELLDVKRYEEAKSIFLAVLEKMGEATTRDGVSRTQVLTWLGVASIGIYATRKMHPGDPELLREAEKYYLDALVADPGYIHAQLNLGAAYYEQGRLDDAIRAFQKALMLDPENSSARENLSAVLEEKLEQRLFDLGLLKEVRKPVRDFTPYMNRTPITVRGKPLSEIIVEDRR